MTDDTALRGTPVQAVHASAYTVPTDAPSADGTPSTAHCRQRAAS